MTAPNSDAPVGVFDSGVGRADRRPRDHRPAARREHDLFRRHRQRASTVRQAAGRSAHGCAGHHGRPGGPWRQGSGDRLQPASSACLRDARERFDVPVVEVICRRPACRGHHPHRPHRRDRNPGDHHPGRIRTPRGSGRHRDHHRWPAHVSSTSSNAVSPAAGRCSAWPGLPSKPLQRAGVDTLVLGCTHYPLLSGLIQLAMGEQVTLVSSAEETARICCACSPSAICCAVVRRTVNDPAPQRRFGLPAIRRRSWPGGPLPQFYDPRVSPLQRRIGTPGESFSANLRSFQCGNGHGTVVTVRITVLGCSGSVVGPDSPARPGTC